MIRFTSCLCLFALSTIVLAQPLYKWVEPDGSITFSPKPPAAGISYETVNAPDQDQSLPPKAPSATTVLKAPVISDALAPTGAAQQLAPQQGIQVSPRPDERRTTETIPADSKRYSQGQANGVMGAAVTRSNSELRPDNGRSTAMTAQSRKRQQCEDLKKRVVSLERRLKTRLTPEDMDNTVIHMARYQRSYDQHCVQ